MGLRRRFALAACGVFLLALLAPAALAQTTGSIAGVVRDAAGGALPGADVLVSSPSLQGSRSARTGRDGRFWIPALPPGVYTVTATRASFRPEAKSVTVSLDWRATADFALEPAVQEAVSVSGAAPPIDFSSTTGGTNYTSRVVGMLPVSRNYADIVRSNPAVDTDRGDTQGRALALTIYGATSAENQWIIDGVNTTNAFKGVQGKAINNEFIEEVEVKTGGYGAEYGRALGGVVNVVTKSGGNAFHGDGFSYFDPVGTSAKQVFTARDSAVEQMRLADYSRFDYGGDLGGFLVKDRLWFFAAYDRVLLSGDVSRFGSSPLVSKDDRFPLDGTDNLYSGKLTWNIAAPTTLVATVFADPSRTTGAAGADPRAGPANARIESPEIVNPDPSTWSSTREVGGADYGLRATQLLDSQGVLALQASYHRDRNLLTAADTIRYEDFTCPGGTPGSPCPQPLAPIAVTGGHGWIDGEADHNLSHRTQYRADLTFSAGSHELKAGADYQDGRSDMTYSVSGGQLVTIRNEYGTKYYVHTFSAHSGTDLTQLPDGRFRARIRDASAYLQDSWRPAAGLTVNLGLRWDGEYLQDYRGVTVLRLTNQWQPRLGVVWGPGKDGRTKLYAAAGRFYYALPTAAMTWWFGDVTGVESYNFDPVALTPDPSVGLVTPDYVPAGYYAFFGGGPYRTPVDRGLQEMYQDELTAGVERLLDPTFTVGLKATYRRLGDAIEDRCDFYDPGSGNGYCAVINPGSGERFGRGDAPTCDGAETCADSGPATPPARRLYRGIELLARKSIGEKLWLQASYVFSSLRGNYDGAINEGNHGTVPGRNIDFDFPALWHNAYGRLFLDRPHRFRLDGYWVTPLRLTVGVQAFAESGAPLDKLGDFGGYGSVVYLVPRGSAGRLPTQWDANLTIGYPISVGPATVILQAYVFNLFNNQIPIFRDNAWTTSPQDGYSILDPNQPSNNKEYGKFTSRQAPRSFRAAIRVSF